MKTYPDLNARKRTVFLSVAAAIAVGVGAAALLFPAQLLASKGTLPSAAANVWMREVGSMLLCVGLIAALVRTHTNSPTLRALILGNAGMQLGLFGVEALAYAQGTITQLGGVLPNLLIHVVLAAGFMYFYADRRGAGFTTG